MLEIKIYDISFAHYAPSWGTGSTGISPKNIKWYTGSEGRPIEVFTDRCLAEVRKSKAKYKVAWIIEPKSIIPEIYKFISNPNVYNKFNYILTHDKSLLMLSNKFMYIPHGGCWIHEKDHKIWNKTKQVSIFASGKKETVGHKLRHEIIDKYQKRLDGIFGKYYNYIKYKIDGLKDYRFNIVIENIITDYYFTEKLIDSLVTGTIPVYYGSYCVKQYFDMRGILLFNNIQIFDKIMNNLVNENYYEYLLKEKVIQRNLEKAKRFIIPEDFAYEVLFKRLGAVCGF